MTWRTEKSQPKNEKSQVRENCVDVAGNELKALIGRNIGWEPCMNCRQDG